MNLCLCFYMDEVGDGRQLGTVGRGWEKSLVLMAR